MPGTRQGERPQQSSDSGTSPASTSSTTTGSKNEWLNIADKTQRKRVQNRLAQQNYRKKIKQRIEELEHQAQVTAKLPLPHTTTHLGPDGGGDEGGGACNTTTGPHHLCHGSCCKVREFHACHAREFHHGHHSHAAAVWPHVDDRSTIPHSVNNALNAVSSLDTTAFPSSLDPSHGGQSPGGSSRDPGLLSSLDFAASFLDDGWLKQLPSAPMAGTGMETISGPGSITDGSHEGFHSTLGASDLSVGSPVSPVSSSIHVAAAAVPTHPLLVGQGLYPTQAAPLSDINAQSRLESDFEQLPPLTQDSRSRSSTYTPPVTSPSQLDIAQDSSLAEKLAYMSRCAKQAGFDSLESVFSAYFFDCNNDSDTGSDKASHVLASSRRLSRNRQLPGILADLRANIGKWSAWEARGCVNELLRCAETILGAEVRDFAGNADVQGLLGGLIRRDVNGNGSDAAATAASLSYSSPMSVSMSIPSGNTQAQTQASNAAANSSGSSMAAAQEEAIYKVSQLLQDKMPNLWAMIMSLSENCFEVPGHGTGHRTDPDHHVVLAALSLLCLSGCIPVEKLVDACLSPGQS